jgi:hypothetical protein
MAHPYPISQYGTAAIRAGGVHRQHTELHILAAEAFGQAVYQGALTRTGSAGYAHHEGSATIRPKAFKLPGSSRSFILNGRNQAGGGQAVTPYHSIRQTGNIFHLRLNLPKRPSSLTLPSLKNQTAGLSLSLATMAGMASPARALMTTWAL